MSYLTTYDRNSNIIRVRLLDSSSTVGAGLTGLTKDSAGLIISSIADVEATATTYTQAGGTIETIATLGTFAAPTATKCRFKEVDATNFPGLYEIQLADARFSVANSSDLIISILGAANLAQTMLHIPLQRFDLQSATVTAGTVSDKSGYSLSQAFPTNFSSMAISALGAVTAGTVGDKTGYALSQTFPANFADLAITGTTGMVTVGTNTDKSGYTASTVSDKSGYALTQVFPTNFEDLAITNTTGMVTVGTNSDKTGYALTTTPPTAAQIDTQLSGTHGAGAWGGSAGSGAVTWTYTVTNSITGLPISGVFVEASTTITGSNVVASGTTDAFGVVTFYLDVGTYYIFCMKSGYNFTNPDTEVVT